MELEANHFKKKEVRLVQKLAEQFTFSPFFGQQSPVASSSDILEFDSSNSCSCFLVLVDSAD